MNETTQVVVLGAGITGLTLAHALARRGVDVRVLEAAPRAGGVIQTLTRDGFVLEQGPFSVMVRSGAFGELLDELSLEAVEVNADASARRYVIRKGKFCEVPTSPMGLVRTPLLSVGGRLRLLRGVFRSKGRMGDVDETMAQVAARRLGPEASAYLAGPASVGIFAAEADELSFDACIPRYAQADREAGSVIGMMKAVKQHSPSTDSTGESQPKRAMIGFEGGLGKLIDRLVAELGESVMLECPVKVIERVGDERGEGGYRIRYAGGEIEADAVVCTTGPGAAGELLDSIVPGIAQELHSIKTAGLGVVHLGFKRADVEHSLDGFGFLLPETERIEPLLGSIWASSIFDDAAPEGHVLIRAIVGGTRWPDAMNWTEAELVRRSFDALKPLLGFRAEPVLAQACYWPSAIPVYEPGHQDRVARVVERLKSVLGLWCAGNWVDGLGVNDRVVAARELEPEVTGYVQAQHMEAVVCQG